MISLNVSGVLHAEAGTAARGASRVALLDQAPYQLAVAFEPEEAVSGLRAPHRHVLDDPGVVAQDLEARSGGEIAQAARSAQDGDGAEESPDVQDLGRSRLGRQRHVLIPA